MTPAAALASLLGTRFDRGFVLVDRDTGTVTVGLDDRGGSITGTGAVRVLPFDPADPRDSGPWAPPPPLVPRWVATVSGTDATPRWSGGTHPPALPGGALPSLPGPVRLELPSPARVRDGVREALGAVRDGEVEKLVPSFGARVVFPAPPPPGILAARLLAGPAGRPDGLTRFAILAGERLLLGATPERLFRLAPGGLLETEALAGTAPAGDGDRLLASPKDREEHELVVRGIRRALAPLVARLDGPPVPLVRRLPGLVHLCTPLVGRVRPGVTTGDVLAALHPTPAVAGAPREPSLAWLRAHEPARGTFAAPLLVERPDGTVEAHVVLRAAVLDGNVLHLRAGAGIVATSDPACEAEEILAKLRATVRGLGLGVPVEASTP